MYNRNSHRGHHNSSRGVLKGLNEQQLRATAAFVQGLVALTEAKSEKEIKATTRIEELDQILYGGPGQGFMTQDYDNDDALEDDENAGLVLKSDLEGIQARLEFLIEQLDTKFSGGALSSEDIKGLPFGKDMLGLVYNIPAGGEVDHPENFRNFYDSFADALVSVESHLKNGAFYPE